MVRICTLRVQRQEGCDFQVSGPNKTPFLQSLVVNSSGTCEACSLHRKERFFLSLAEETNVCLWNLPAYQSTCWPLGSLRITVTITYFKAHAGILVLLSLSHFLHTLNSPAQGFLPSPTHSPSTPATLDVSFFGLISLCRPSSASLPDPSLLLVFPGQVQAADHAHSTTFSFYSRLFQRPLVAPALTSFKTKKQNNKTRPNKTLSP